MSSSRNLITIVVVLLVVLLAGIFFLKQSQTPPVHPTLNNVIVTPSPSSTQSGSDSSMMKETVISINSNGFIPATVTVKVGDNVTWINNDTVVHQVNSDPHPTHTDYPPLNSIGRLQAGDKKSLSFPTSGVYKFHDHLNPQFTGSVTVHQ